MRSFRLLLLLGLLTFFLGLGRPAISDSDEAFYAEAAKEMVEGGDWLTPHYNFEYRFQKPILYYWLTAAAYEVAGVGEGAARFWSAMSGLGLMLVAWAAARRLYDPTTAWIAGAIVATSFGAFAMARLALPDLALAFVICLAIWSTWRATLDADGRARAWWLLAGLALGLGFLTKGPVAIVLPAIVIAPLLWVARRRVVLDWTGVALGALVAAVAGLPWYVAMTAHHGMAYLQSFFLGDNFERFATDRFNDPRPMWFYVPIVLGGLMPWTPFMALWARPVRDVVRRARRVTESEWGLLAWAILPLVFYTASVGKQPRYILPVLPPIAVLLATSVARAFRDDNPRRDADQRLVRMAAIVIGVLMLLLGVLLLRARPVLVAVDPTTSLLAVVIVMGAGGWLLATARGSSIARVVVVTPCAAALLLLALQFGAFAAAAEDPVQRMAQGVRMNRLAQEPVGAYRVFVRNLVFYTGIPQVDLFNETRLADFVRSPERVLLVITESDLDTLQRAAGVKLVSLGTVTYFPSASVKLGTLLSADPSAALSKVVLVTNRP